VWIFKLFPRQYNTLKLLYTARKTSSNSPEWCFVFTVIAGGGRAFPVATIPPSESVTLYSKLLCIIQQFTLQRCPWCYSARSLWLFACVSSVHCMIKWLEYFIVASPHTHLTSSKTFRMVVGATAATITPEWVCKIKISCLSGPREPCVVIAGPRVSL
jgi:hypothetical protein